MAVTPTDARVVPDCLMCHDQSGQYTKTYWDRFAAGRMGPDGKSMHENNWVRSDGKKRHTDLSGAGLRVLPRRRWAIGHSLLRLMGRKQGEGFMSRRIVRAHPRFERLWHWSQMVLVFVVMLTGLGSTDGVGGFRLASRDG